ncbi:uncharacterized protein LOC124153300 [Ischnura elegans]|uniref:uncharacterized protein LOC124153300 n=1 Tax=Ischnura elegans TaxID=197161 RepID=UPI001ED8BFE4|nr:uncharacterized protein LOC124153300 [Ischnura elegans]
MLLCIHPAIDSQPTTNVVSSPHRRLGQLAVPTVLLTGCVTNETTKFSHVVAQLDQRHAVEVEDIILNPPEGEPYKRIKGELIQRLSVSQDQKIRQLLEQEELGDRKPSHLLRSMRSLAGASMPDDILRSLWLNRLPSLVQSILAVKDGAELNNLAKLADKVQEVTPRPHVAAVSHHPEMDALRKQIEELTCQVATLSAARSHFRGRSRSRSRRWRSRSPSAHDNPNWCWYHSTFGAEASKCRQPCSFVAGNTQGSV